MIMQESEKKLEEPESRICSEIAAYGQAMKMG